MDTDWRKITNICANSLSFRFMLSYTNFIGSNPFETGADFLDSCCALELSFWPINSDLINGSFHATAHKINPSQAAQILNLQ